LRPFASLSRPYLCVITDEALSDDRIVAACEAACAAAPLVVQLRVRNRSGHGVWKLAARLREVTRRYDHPFVVNDRLDVALAVDADGLHLPARSHRADAVRAALAKRDEARTLFLGLSVHSPQEAASAPSEIDSLQFGHVFATPSKPAAGPRGLDVLAEAVASARGTDVVAVGGIDENTIAGLVSAGVAGVAVIRAVMRARDPGDAARRLVAALTEAAARRGRPSGEF
jgi:thiamine-phosphate pyrophosphorylase